jgi:hypothetical protein
MDRTIGFPTDNFPSAGRKGAGGEEKGNVLIVHRGAQLDTAAESPSAIAAFWIGSQRPFRRTIWYITFSCRLRAATAVSPRWPLSARDRKICEILGPNAVVTLPWGSLYFVLPATIHHYFNQARSGSIATSVDHLDIERFSRSAIQVRGTTRRRTHPAFTIGRLVAIPVSQM